MKRTERTTIARETVAIIRLMLGAWGCGVFRNDPRMVARSFAAYLDKGGKFAGCFDEVVFAIYDNSENRSTYKAFAEVF